MKAMVLCSSPRRDGNSATMANAVAEGLREAGHEVETVRADDILSGLLRDCRQCRMPDGQCGIDDGFRRAFFGSYLPADGFIAASPIYWYGVSAQLKAFFDRMFCYVAASHPQSASVVAQMTGKRIGLVLSSEETYPTVSSGPQHQFQEFSRHALDLRWRGARPWQRTQRHTPRSERPDRAGAPLRPDLLQRSHLRLPD